MVECMAGFIGDDMPHDGHADERKISDAVQRFMTNKFVRIAKPILIENPIAIDHHGVLQ